MSTGSKLPITFTALIVISILAGISEPLGFLALIVVLIARAWNQPAK